MDYMYSISVSCCARTSTLLPQRNQWVQMLAIDGVVLAVTIAVSALSYRYFETPFLVLKQRFEFIRSRPA
jgi:peptidoglycan/LPS O-acetylase OafA/YrhL